MKRSLAVAAVAALLLPAHAVGALRVASAAGTGSTCSEAAPCSLQEALTGPGVGAGDEILVRAGSYTVTGAPLTVTAANLTVRGESALAKPVIAASGLPTDVTIQVNAAGLVLRDVQVSAASSAPALAFNGLSATSGVLERAEVRNTGSGAGLVSRSLTVRDSIVAVAGAVPAVVMTGTVTGSTFVGGTGAALSIDDNFFTTAESLVVRNSILRGGGAADVEVVEQQPAPASGSLDIAFSAVRPGGAGVTGTPAGTLTVGPGNVSAATLVNASGGADVRQAAGSATIDAGLAAAVAGSSFTDFEGDPRTVSGTPDIGADESTPKPTATTVAATAVTTTTATLNASINPNGKQTSYYFDFGTTPAYGVQTSIGSAANGATPVALSGSLTGLTPGTTYHFRVVATNASGTTQGADVSFTTAGTAPPAEPPAPPAGPDPAAPTDDTNPPSLGTPTLTSPDLRTGRSLTLRVRLTERSRVVLTLDRLQPGRRVAGRCVVNLRNGPRCTKVTRVTSITRASVPAGTVALTIPARRFTKPGRYRVTVVAVDSSGNASKALTRTVIVR